MQPFFPSPRRAVSSRPLRGRGYTIVEVMMALSILAVGAAGIMALQKVTITSSLQARNLTSGVNVNAAWLDRLQIEAVRWNAVGNTDLADMTTVNAVGGLTGAAPVGTWRALGTSTLEGVVGGTPAAYCTHARFTWMGDPAACIAATGAGCPDSIRVELRTFWARSGRALDAECAAAAADWDDAIADNTDTLSVGGVDRTRDEYGWSFMTGNIRRNEL